MSDATDLLSQPEKIEPWSALEWLLALLILGALIGGAALAVQTWS